MRTTEQATITLVSGLHFTGGTASGHMLDLDATVENGGENAGFQPLELVLVSLGGCTAMDVISILRKMKQEVTAYEIRVTGERAETHPRVYTSVNVEHVFRGRGLNEEAVQRAINLSNDKYCSAMAMLKQAVPIATSYRIIEEHEEEGGQ